MLIHDKNISIFNPLTSLNESVINSTMNCIRLQFQSLQGEGEQHQLYAALLSGTSKEKILHKLKQQISFFVCVITCKDILG